jgi:MFS family permease
LEQNGRIRVAITKKGWLVTMAGLGLNLALGVLYAWSVFSKQLTESIANGGFGWSRTTATLPYTIAIACFALVMIPAGRFQDRLGPRVVATAGAVLCGAGLVVASLGRADFIWPIVIGFGTLAGTGIGLGYAAATPAAVKWFGPEKKGLITGIVVAGFGGGVNMFAITVLTTLGVRVAQQRLEIRALHAGFQCHKTNPGISCSPNWSLFATYHQRNKNRD